MSADLGPTPNPLSQDFIDYGNWPRLIKVDGAARVHAEPVSRPESHITEEETVHGKGIAVTFSMCLLALTTSALPSQATSSAASREPHRFGYHYIDHGLQLTATVQPIPREGALGPHPNRPALDLKIAVRNRSDHRIYIGNITGDATYGPRYHRPAEGCGGEGFEPYLAAGHTANAHGCYGPPKRFHRFAFHAYWRLHGTFTWRGQVER
jgi:hypothetical protein